MYSFFRRNIVYPIGHVEYVGFIKILEMRREMMFLGHSVDTRSEGIITLVRQPASLGTVY